MQPTKDRRSGAGPQIRAASNLHTSTANYFQPVLPDQGSLSPRGQIHGNPLTGGHSTVNILFCSSVIKRNSVSSEMLEVPYGERNIIISLSSSCTHVLTELLKPQGLCSQSPNQGKRGWEYSQETYSQKFRLWLLWRAPSCAHPVCGHLEHVLNQIESDSHNSPKAPPGQVLLSSCNTDDTME